MDNGSVPVWVGRMMSLSGSVTGAPACSFRLWRHSWSTALMKWLVAPLSPLAITVVCGDSCGGGTSEEENVWFNFALIRFKNIEHAAATSSSKPRPYSWSVVVHRKVLPPILLAKVDSSICPDFLLAHSVLVWPQAP